MKKIMFFLVVVFLTSNVFSDQRKLQHRCQVDKLGHIIDCVTVYPEDQLIKFINIFKQKIEELDKMIADPKIFIKEKISIIRVKHHLEYILQVLEMGMMPPDIIDTMEAMKMKISY